MSTRLEKRVIETYVPGRPGTPGDPGQPYLPARRVWESYEVCSYVPLTMQELSQIYAGMGVTWQYSPQEGRWVLIPPPGSAGFQIPTGRRVCRMESHLVEHPAQPYRAPVPAVPGTPAQTIYDYQLGWNSRARSIKPMAAAGRFEFSVPSAVVGVVVGLTPQPQRSGYGDIQWGFKVAQGVLSIVEKGVEVQTIGGALGERLGIERAGGRITYFVGGSEVRSVPNSSVPMYLGAAMYSGGDSVLESELIELGESGQGAEELAPVQAFGGTVAYAIGAAVFTPLQAEGGAEPAGGGAAVMLPVFALGSDNAAFAYGIEAMETMDAEGGGWEELGYALGSGMLSPIIVAGAGTSGGIGGGAAGLLEIFAIGADASGYGQGAEVIEFSVRDTGQDLPPTGIATIVSTIMGFDRLDTGVELFAVINSGFGVQGLLAVQPIVTASLPAGIGFGETLVPQQVLRAVLASVMEARASALDPTAIEPLTVWALNTDMGERGGTTRYSNFDFNSFARIGDTYFGAKADGIYRLGGRDDGDEEVNASINFGNLNFGMLERKGLPHVYAGVASDGQLVLKVTAEGQTFHYRVRGSSEELKTQRFDLGRGLRATYYELVLVNEGGSLFDLASIEFNPIKLSRRL